jgi:threonine synthase
VHYISTRGNAPKLGFSDVTLEGLASDGGLYLPERWPRFDAGQIQKFRGLSYADLATEILQQFCGDDLSKEVIASLTKDAYGDFDHCAIAPLKQLDTSLFVMELFHGPTLAFKDFALQFLGRLFNYLLRERGQTCTIIGATSGDTGSAAIQAVRGLEAVTLYMLHPDGRVSEVQRKQMTTVLDANIHNLAVAGTFDDCQNLVKAMFNDAGFRARHNLSAVNSINWARIAAQVVYYFRAALELGAPGQPVNFSVPTGNFGNVLAGYVAKQMGLPINRLIIGSNSNDILTRFFESGKMEQKGVSPTLSPSMDIQISSNFERYLFELLDRDTAKIRDLMQEFSSTGHFEISAADLAKASQLFAAHRLNDAETSEEISRVFKETGEIMDPHSVIGVAAARIHAQPGIPTIVLGTAHPAKFAQAAAAATGVNVELPAAVKKILDGEERAQKIGNDLEQIQRLIDSDSIT